LYWARLTEFVINAGVGNGQDGCGEYRFIIFSGDKKIANKAKKTNEPVGG
jgi:hypothetical protein